jgi:hypothetical protein
MGSLGTVTGGSSVLPPETGPAHPAAAQYRAHIPGFPGVQARFWATGVNFSPSSQLHSTPLSQNPGYSKGLPWSATPSQPTNKGNRVPGQASNSARAHPVSDAGAPGV